MRDNLTFKDNAEVMTQMVQLKNIVKPDLTLTEKTKEKIDSSTQIYRFSLLIIMLPSLAIIILGLVYWLGYARPVSSQLYHMVIEQTTETEVRILSQEEINANKDYRVMFDQYCEHVGSSFEWNDYEIDQLKKSASWKREESLNSYLIGFLHAKISVRSTDSILYEDGGEIGDGGSVTTYHFKRTKKGWIIESEDLE